MNIREIIPRERDGPILGWNIGRRLLPWMQSDGLETAILKQGQRAGLCARQLHRSFQKFAGEIRQAEQTVDLARQLNQNIRPPAIGLGLMQVVSHFQNNGNLRCQCLRPPDVFA
jgi:hypothetical protein